MTRHFICGLVAAFAILSVAPLSQKAARGAGAEPSLPVLSATDLDSRLASIASECRDASDDSSAPDPATDLKSIAVCELKAADGRLSIMHNEWLLAGILDAESEKSADLRAGKLDGVASAIDEERSLLKAKPLSAANRGDAVESARKLLGSNLYSVDPIPPKSGAELAMRRFWKWLQKKLTPKSSAPAPAWHLSPTTIAVLTAIWAVLWVIIKIAAVVFVVGLVAWLIVLLMQYMARVPARRKPEALLAMTDEEATLVAARDFDKLLDLARQRADSGDYRSAFRLVYLSTLVTLDTLGLVRLNRSRTNWEYLRDLRSGAHSELAELLRPMTVDFDRIWYGSALAGRPQYDSALDRHKRLRAAADQRAVTPVGIKPLTSGAAAGMAKR